MMPHLFASLCLLAGAEAELPNIVIVYADDLGYGDIGVFGAQGYATPNIDRMAKEGRTFRSFYVAQPVCSASRAALLTGCYSNRIGIHGALGPQARHGISAGETTLAELCRSKGYATAIFGKWHLGSHRPFLPLQHGFDEYVGIPYSNDMWPNHPSLARLPDESARKRGYPDLPLYDGNDIAIPEITHDDQERFTGQFTDRAVDFIKRNRENPFFLYVPHPMPHVPIHASSAFRGKTAQGLYGDVIEEIDASVGRIVETIDSLGLTDRTLVIFASDNGPWTSYGNHAGSPGGLREAKGTCFEGGVRVPCVMRWPTRIPAGSTCHEPLMTIDLFPTIARLIGAPLPSHPIDGKEAWSLIAGEMGAKSPQEAYFFYYHEGDLEAMRSGRWKLHFPHQYRTLAGRPGGRDGTPADYEQRKIGLELYDLENDISETRDVAAEHPEVVAELSRQADVIRKKLGDRLTKVVGDEIREPGRLSDDDRS